MESTTYYSGIDLHKRTSYIATINQHGETVKEANLKNHPAAICTYFATLPGRHKAVVESTPNWYWLADLLHQQSIELQLAHAKYLKAITYAKVKTDKVDAHTLAQLLRMDMIPQAHQISAELRWPRDVLRTRLALVCKRTAAQNAIARLLGKFNAKNDEQLPRPYHLQLRCYQEQITLLNEQIRALEAALHPHLAPNPDIQRLAHLPGIGVIVAYTLYLEIDGIERFPTEKQFLSYCRLVPGAKNSAASRRHKRGNKDGNRHLKIAFNHCAVRAIQYYKEVKDFYRTQRRKKPEAIARTIVAKELARIVYHVLREQTDFNGSFKGKPLSRQKTLAWPLRASPAA